MKKLEIKRNRPALHVTVSPDIAEWIHQKAGSSRGAVSRLCERILYDTMRGEAGKLAVPESKNKPRSKR